MTACFSIARRCLGLCWARLLLVLGCVLALGPAPAHAQGGALVSLQPLELALGVGETQAVAVVVQNAAAVYGFEVHLRYDPALVRILDANPGLPGEQVAAGDLFDAGAGFVAVNRADNQAGELVYAFTLLAPAPAVSGSGALVTFELQGAGAGLGALTVQAILASPDGEALPLNVQDGQVAVSDGGGAQPTLTPLPTPTAAVQPSRTPPPDPGQTLFPVSSPAPGEPSATAPAGQPVRPTASQGTAPEIVLILPTTSEPGRATGLAPNPSQTPAATAPRPITWPVIFSSMAILILALGGLAWFLRGRRGRPGAP